MRPALGARAAFAVLLPTLECNLVCSYCFQERRPGRWDEAQAVSVVEQVLDWAAADGRQGVHLHWQGGEPLLLGAAFWRAVWPRAAELAAARGLDLTQSLQTNLLLYDSDLADLVISHLGGEIGSSFEPAARRALPGARGAERFRDQWRASLDRARADGIRVGVLCLLSEELLEQGPAETLRSLREDYGIERVRFTLPFQQAADEAKGYFLDPEATGEFLATLYRLWSEAGGDTALTIRPFAHLRSRIRGETPAEPGTCESVPSCSELSLAVLPTGEVTLCDNFAHPLALESAGNVFERSLTEIRCSDAWTLLAQATRVLVDETCCACRYLPLCFGGCLAKLSGAEGARRFHYCATYQALFREIEAVEGLSAECTRRAGPGQSRCDTRWW